VPAPSPSWVTVDLVVLAIRDDDLCALTVPGEAGGWALPGAYVTDDEDLLATARRSLRGVAEGDASHIEQLASYGAPHRDPRQRTVSVAYLVLLRPDAHCDEGARLRPVSELLGGLGACDHAAILADGVERVSAKFEYTPLATALCPPEFTVGELRRVYEVVWGMPLDPRNFHRKVTGAHAFLLPTGRTTTRQGGRPAQLYRAGSVQLLNPPMLRHQSGR
jgi:8-oxo-dGTP diphosphatase